QKALEIKPGADSMPLQDQVFRLFGKQNLLKGKPGAKVEATTVAWAVMDKGQARVVRGDGTLIGEMTGLGAEGLQVLVRTLPNFQEFNYLIEVDVVSRTAGMVRIEHFELTPDSNRQPGVP